MYNEEEENMILRFEAVHDFAPLTTGEIELRQVSFNDINITLSALLYFIRD